MLKRASVNFTFFWSLLWKLSLKIKLIVKNTCDKKQLNFFIVERYKKKIRSQHHQKYWFWRFYMYLINLNIFCWKIHLHVHTNGLNTSYCNLIILYKILIYTMHLWIKWREYKLFQIHIRHLHVSNSSYQQYIQMITGMIGSNAGFWHTLSKL